jgi:predicted ABC-type transport system involved in lysophospholipase L1 biosynthesis ATPase subunit
MARIPKEERHAIVDAIVESSSDNMHILEMRIENIKRVRFAHIKPKGNTIVIAGKNGQGKSSVLDAVAWALTGTSMIPRYPIRKGQRTGSVKVDIGDFLITRQFTVVDEEKSTKDNTYLSKLLVTGKRGEAFPSPQVLLDKLLGKFGFDPMAFTRMGDDEQLEELRGLVKFDIDIDALDALQKADYDLRREAGRAVDALKSRLAAMAVPAADLPVDAIDVAAITEKLRNAATHNSGVAARRVEQESLLRRQVAALESAAKIDEQIREMISQAEGMDGKSRTYTVNAKAHKNGLWQQLLKQAEAIVVGDEIDTAAVAAELTRANETNAAIQRAANYRQLEKDLDAEDENWTAIDKRMKERDLERAAAIARAQMPIEKLSIGHGEVVYNGLPLNQASNAEQIRVSMALGMAANPKVRLLCIRDGSLLDADSLKLIDELAEANNFQVLMERVETDGKVSVIMEDGEASGDDVEVENAAR